MKMLKVLVVDDELVMRNLLEAFLTGIGHIVETADGAHMACRILDEERFDLVITDLQMGDSTGLDVVRKMKKMARQTAVYMITGCYEAGYAREAFRLGVDAYLYKPFSFHDLSDLMQPLCERRRDLPEKSMPAVNPADPGKLSVSFTGSKGLS